MRVSLALGLCLLLGMPQPATAQEWQFQALRQLIESHSVDRVETLLGLLPEDLRAHYALVFASRSLQDASFESPRAVLFGRSAHFVLTFNGEASQRGFDAVETMEFDSETHGFVFREIQFAPGQPQSVSISAPNPPRCVACHGQPARPIWDVAPLWPGVYGERYGAGLSAVEQRGMQRFLAAQEAHPRYRNLSNIAALAERRTYVASARDAYNSVASEPPNARLSVLLANLNVNSILSSLASRPGFAAHLDALLAASSTGCGSIVNFFPSAMQARVAADLGQFGAAARSAARLQSQSKNLRRASREHAYAGARGPVDLIELRYVAERSLGVPTQHWTLAFERGTYDLAAPSGSLTLEQALFRWLARTDADLSTAAAYRTYDPDEGYCRHLRRGSQAALAAWYERYPPPAPTVITDNPAAPTLGPRPPPALQQCAACHGTGAAPLLPFDDPSALAARLREGGYAHGRLLDEILFRLTPQAGIARMPRGVNLDDEEQYVLEDYFLRLAQSP